MSKNKTYRTDKTCLNCRHVVDQKFCPNCGQENTDIRKTFHHLFLHFFEDLTHYENAFWRTIKNLLFRPAALTKEYLSGKRLSYLAPVRLYIFISFVTFFTIFLLGGNKFVTINKHVDFRSKSTVDSIQLSKILTLVENKTDLKIKNDSLLKIIAEAKKQQKEDNSNFNVNGVHSIKELDSIQKFGKKEDKKGRVDYWITKKILTVKKNNTEAEILEKGLASAKQNIPKVLIIYMPFFAFFLWLFHGKKRWYYFDHGIFTLHYFSFLLIMVLLLSLIGALHNALIKHWTFDVVYGLLILSGWLWTIYYFFPAHHRFYGETRWKSFFKSLLLLLINYFFVLIFLVIFAFYTIINIH